MNKKKSKKKVAKPKRKRRSGSEKRWTPPLLPGTGIYLGPGTTPLLPPD